MRVLALCLFSLISFSVFAQNTNLEQEKPNLMRMKLRQLFDLKMYHDPVFVKRTIKDISNKEETPVNITEEYGVIYTKEDFDVIKNETLKKMQNQTELIWEEQEKLIDENPYEAFMAYVENYKVPSLTNKELERMNTVDKQVIPETLIMLTESGPDIGSGAVSVIYEKK